MLACPDGPAVGQARADEALDAPDVLGMGAHDRRVPVVVGEQARHAGQGARRLVPHAAQATRVGVTRLEQRVDPRVDGAGPLGVRLEQQVVERVEGGQRGADGLVQGGGVGGDRGGQRAQGSAARGRPLPRGGVQGRGADAQVTRGAVYHHFKDKQDLFAAVLDRTETEGMDAVRDAYLAHEDTVTGAFAAISAYLDHGLDPEYAEIVLRQGPIALGWEQWTQTQSRYAAGLIEQIITSLVSSGRIVSLPIETTSAITFNALAGCATAIAGTDPADRERVRRECGEVMVHLLSGLLV